MNKSTATLVQSKFNSIRTEIVETCPSTFNYPSITETNHSKNNPIEEQKLNLLNNLQFSSSNSSVNQGNNVDCFFLLKMNLFNLFVC